MEVDGEAAVNETQRRQMEEYKYVSDQLHKLIWYALIVLLILVGFIIKAKKEYPSRDACIIGVGMGLFYMVARAFSMWLGLDTLVRRMVYYIAMLFGCILIVSLVDVIVDYPKKPTFFFYGIIIMICATFLAVVGAFLRMRCAARELQDRLPPPSPLRPALGTPQPLPPSPPCSAPKTLTDEYRTQVVTSPV